MLTLVDPLNVNPLADLWSAPEKNLMRGLGILFSCLIGVAVVLPQFLQHESSGPNRDFSSISELSGMVSAFYQDVGRFPTDAEGLQALRIQPKGCKRWRGPYSEKPLPLDSWGRAYHYYRTHEDSFEIISYGADGRPGGEGSARDISNQAD